MAENIFVFVGVYDSDEAAAVDYEAVKDLHRDGVIGTYDAAVLKKDPSGKVHVHKREKPAQHGAWSGLAVGALVGILFPPSIIAGGVVGATAGGLVGHLWRGMSRHDMKELGQVLDEGEASLVVVGESKLEEVLAEALTGAIRTYEKAIDAQAEDVRDELEQAIDQEAA